MPWKLSHHAEISFYNRKEAPGFSLEDLPIESGVYAAGSTTALMNGRSYNRRVCQQELCFEPFFRLLWKAFLEEQGSALMARSTSIMFPACRATTTEVVEVLRRSPGRY